MAFDTSLALSIQAARTIDVGRGNGGTNPVVPADGQLLLSANATITSRGQALKIVSALSDASSSTNAAHRNAYPGLEWDYLMTAGGGKWPYYWTVDGPSGMTIQGNPALSGTLLVFGGDYERLIWNNPTVGSHPVTVYCTDQAGTTVSTTFTLVVGTANHVFIDPVLGNNSNDGTINLPLQNDFGLHGGSYTTSAHSGKTVWVSSGFLVNGMTDANNNYRLGSGAPFVFRAMPGTNPELLQQNGKFIAFNQSDIYFSGFKVNHASTGWTADASNSNRHHFMITGSSNRVNLCDITSENYTTGPTTAENPALVYCSNEARSGFVMKNWDVSGATGTLFNTYALSDSVFERLRIHNATMANSDSSSNNAAMRLKSGSHVGVTIRNNELWENITWQSGNGCIGLPGEVSQDKIDICYNKVSHPTPVTRSGAIFLWSASAGSSPQTDIHIYRNSVNTVRWEGDSNNIVSEYWDNNVIEGPEVTAPEVTNTNNIHSADYLDASFNLAAAYDGFKGTHGADVYNI